MEVADQHGFKLMLANLRHVLEYGLLPGSFAPSWLIRYQQLMQNHTNKRQRIAKILKDTVIKIDSAVSRSRLRGASARMFCGA